MEDRRAVAEEIARSAGGLALDYFRRLDTLAVEEKGAQDFVTVADRAVEDHIRELITAKFPEDGIVGEERAPKQSDSGYTWIIDPIDGTANFINAIPIWAVVLAVVAEDRTQIGITYDPVHDEMFAATRGNGAILNGAPLINPRDTALSRGTVAVGMSTRSDREKALRLFRMIFEAEGLIVRNGSGAVSLAHVAAGRYLGYAEQHMNAWDCLAGQLLISEAGGVVEAQSADRMVAQGGRVVAGSVGVFQDLVKMADAAFGS